MIADPLHFAPSDGYFGDAMPLFAEGVYHVYYTKLYKTGEIGWGHISSPDLVAWTEHPDPLPNHGVGSPVSTGCVVFADGLYHAFYGGRAPDGSAPLMRAVSRDGITFEWDGKIAVPLPQDTKYYRADGTWRDPDVFFDDERNIWRMVFCAKSPEIPEKPDLFPGSVGNAVSHDLESWTLLPPFDEAGVCGGTECPDIFRIGENRWAMLYYWHETRVRVASSLAGPWRRTGVLSPDGFDFMAAKRMSDGARHISVGWLPRRTCDCCKRVWGGNMLFPRVLTFGEDGTPSSRFAPELKKLFTRRVRHGLTASRGEWTITPDSARVNAGDGGAFAIGGERSSAYLLECDITLSDERATVIMLVNLEPSGEGYQIIFDAADGLVRLREQYEWDQRNDVETAPLRVSPGAAFHVELIVNGDILELCADSCRTLVSRLSDHTSGRFALSVQDGEAALDNLFIYER